jgi:hypothetical protein
MIEVGTGGLALLRADANAGFFRDQEGFFAFAIEGDELTMIGEQARMSPSILRIVEPGFGGQLRA